MLILTGPTASGKNTIGYIVAKSHPQCTLIDYDVIHNMFVNPHLPPWNGVEGKSQQILGMQHVEKIATGFRKSGWQVVILDVLNNNTLKEYKRLFSGEDIKIVQLLPSFKETYKRLLTRGRCLTDEEFKKVYKEQENLRNYDLRLDNTNISPEEILKKIKEYL